MKILDPISGLRQITSGKFFFPRRIALNGIRSKDISVTELGYFLIALTSTDWDKGKYRFGIIRHEPKRLAEIWSIPYPTLLQNFNSLVKEGLLSKQGGSFQITDFSEFQKATGKYSNNNTTTETITIKKPSRMTLDLSTVNGFIAALIPTVNPIFAISEPMITPNPNSI